MYTPWQLQQLLKLVNKTGPYICSNWHFHLSWLTSGTWHTVLCSRFTCQGLSQGDTTQPFSPWNQQPVHLNSCPEIGSQIFLWTPSRKHIVSICLLASNHNDALNYLGEKGHIHGLTCWLISFLFYQWISWYGDIASFEHLYVNRVLLKIPNIHTNHLLFTNTYNTHLNVLSICLCMCFKNRFIFDWDQGAIFW